MIVVVADYQIANEKSTVADVLVRVVIDGYLAAWSMIFPTNKKLTDSGNAETRFGMVARVTGREEACE